MTLMETKFAADQTLKNSSAYHRRRYQRNLSGFTAIELLIVVGIMILLIGFSAYAFFGGVQSEKQAESEAKSLMILLKSAQEKATTQDANSRWAVYVNTDPTRDIYYLYQVDETLLAAGSFDPTPGTVFDQKTVRGSLQIILDSAATSTNIIFAKDTGLPSASTTITIQNVSNSVFSSSVVISANGRITYQ